MPPKMTICPIHSGGNLVSATIDGVSTNLYAYDVFGNLTNEVQNGTVIARDYDAFRRPTGYRLLPEGGRVALVATEPEIAVSYSYDALLVANEYDAQSRRVRKVTPTATHAYFYDDWNLVKERTAYTNGATSTIHYIWGNDFRGLSPLSCDIYRASASLSYQEGNWLHYDHDIYQCCHCTEIQFKFFVPKISDNATYIEIIEAIDGAWGSNIHIGNGGTRTFDCKKKKWSGGFSSERPY